MSYFHLRYDYPDSTHLERIIDFVRRIDCTNRLIVMEKKSTNDKDHVHCIFTDRRSENQVRKTFRDKFPNAKGKDEKGKGECKDYQLKPIKADDKRTLEESLYDAEKYLCKGDNTLTQPNIVLQTGKYTAEFTVQAHIDYWLLNEFLNKNKKMDDKGPMDQYMIVTHRVEKVVKQKKNFYNDVIDMLHMQYPEREWTLRDTPIMYHTVLKMHGKHFRPYGPQQLENELNIIMNILCHGAHSHDMYEVLKSRGNIPHL